MRPLEFGPISRQLRTISQFLRFLGFLLHSYFIILFSREENYWYLISPSYSFFSWESSGSLNMLGESNLRRRPVIITEFSQSQGSQNILGVSQFLRKIPGVSIYQYKMTGGVKISQDIMGSYFQGSPFAAVPDIAIHEIGQTLAIHLT